jgi:metal-responsive CopG/Arc/MetJ family transcriptional regulator
MSTQIAIRLADSLVAELDRVVASGRARSRASLVEAALERELRRLAAASDAETLHRVGTADDLDGLVEWTVVNIGVGE